jgi:hypothetical protein
MQISAAAADCANTRTDLRSVVHEHRLAVGRHHVHGCLTFISRCHLQMGARRHIGHNAAQEWTHDGGERAAMHGTEAKRGQRTVDTGPPCT